MDQPNLSQREDADSTQTGKRTYNQLTVRERCNSSATPPTIADVSSAIRRGLSELQAGRRKRQRGRAAVDGADITGLDAASPSEPSVLNQRLHGPGGT